MNSRARRARCLRTESPCELSDDAAHRLLNYAELIQRYRSYARLTSLRSLKQIDEVLIAESLQLLRLLPSEGECRLGDLGTGAGIPGLPLLIASPSLRLTLFERSTRKAAFLRIVVSELKLEGAEIVEEDLARIPAGAYAFDAGVSRGALPLPQLLPLAAKMLASGGCLLGFASEDTRKDLEVPLPNGFSLDRIVEYHLAGGRSGLVYSLRLGEATH